MTAWTTTGRVKVALCLAATVAEALWPPQPSSELAWWMPWFGLTASALGIPLVLSVQAFNPQSAETWRRPRWQSGSRS